MKVLILLTLLSFTLALHSNHKHRICKNRRTKPICGGDGKTYLNICLMRHANVEKDHDGPCETCRRCQGQFEPVCGYDEKTYFNSCYADCEGTFVKSVGVCDLEEKAGSCNCTEEVHRECGVDGATYLNQCEARCADVEVDYHGKCNVTCGCDLNDYSPVCGSDR